MHSMRADVELVAEAPIRRRDFPTAKRVAQPLQDGSTQFQSNPLRDPATQHNNNTTTPQCNTSRSSSSPPAPARTITRRCPRRCPPGKTTKRRRGGARGPGPRAKFGGGERRAEARARGLRQGRELPRAGARRAAPRCRRAASLDVEDGRRRRGPGRVAARAGKECEIPNFKGSDEPRVHVKKFIEWECN